MKGKTIMKNIIWKFGENKYQVYYEARIGKDYLCVFCNKWNHEIYMGMVNDRMIHNKTRNDRQRKKQGLDKNSHCSELAVDWILSGSPEYLKKKVEYCYKHDLTEISE